MLLRRITKHVKTQNWFAVFIDFIIVVVGVFIGIQVANWNEEKASKSGLAQSLQRLDKEVALNVDIIDNILEHLKQGEAQRTVARDALSQCQYSPEAQLALEKTLYDLTDDYLPNFVTFVLEQINRQDRYLDLFTNTFQIDFNVYKRILKEEHEQITSHYNNMWFHHVNHHPSVDANFTGEVDEWYFKLGKPFQEICDDSSFRNRFVNTLGFLTAIEARLHLSKHNILKFRDSIKLELQNY